MHGNSGSNCLQLFAGWRSSAAITLMWVSLVHLDLLTNDPPHHHSCHSIQVRLIVVDSIALPFRYEFEDIPQRNRLLAALSQSLLALAGSQNAAVS